VFKSLEIKIVFASMLFACSMMAHSDPTRPSDFAVQQVNEQANKTVYHLESVLVSKNRRVAVFNGRAVVEGDHVDGAKVVLISKGMVRLNRAGRFIKLTLEQFSIRRKS